LLARKTLPFPLAFQSLEHPDLALLSSVVTRCALPFPQRAMGLKDALRVPRRNHQLPAE
jgi:hypothetical protein